MCTIGTVVFPQMPKQVWQADDGSVFESEAACLKHERAGELMRELFDSQSGEKKHCGNYEDLYDFLAQAWSRLHPGFCLEEDSYEVAQLLIILHKSNEIQRRQHLTELAGAMKKLGTYLERE